MIESITWQLRKVTKNRGHFPTKRVILKLLTLAVRNITTTRGSDARHRNLRVEDLPPTEQAR